jgi:hypothetical protein
MVAMGFGAADAQGLVRQTGASSARVAVVLAHAMTRPAEKRRGFVVKALRENWQLSPLDLRSVNAVGRSEAKRAAAEAEALRQQEIDRELAAQRDAIDAMSETEWAGHLEALLPSLTVKARQDAAAGHSRHNRLIRAAVFARVQSQRAVMQ